MLSFDSRGSLVAAMVASYDDEGEAARMKALESPLAGLLACSIWDFATFTIVSLTC